MFYDSQEGQTNSYPYCRSGCGCVKGEPEKFHDGECVWVEKRLTEEQPTVPCPPTSCDHREGHCDVNCMQPEKDTTIEAIVKILPKLEECPDGGEEYIHGYKAGLNKRRSEVITLLPKIIAKVEKRKVEEIRKMIELTKNELKERDDQRGDLGSPEQVVCDYLLYSIT